MFGRRLFNIVWKELALIKSQRLAMILIIIFPFIAVQFFVSSFSSFSLTQMSEIQIGLINEVGEYSDQNIFNFGKDVKIVNFAPTETNLMIKSIQEKNILAGIVISQEASKRILCDIYYDNTSVMSAPVITEIASAGIQRAASKKAQEKLGEIFSIIRQMSPKIKEETQKLASFKSRLVSAEASLEELDLRLKSIDINKAENMVVEQQLNLTDANAQAEQIIKELEDSQEDFYDIKTEFAFLKTSFNTYSIALNGIVSTMNVVTISLDSQIASLKTMAEQLPEPNKSAMLSTIKDLNTNLTLINQLNPMLVLANTSAQAINTKLTRIDSLITKMDALYQRLEENKISFREKISSAKVALSDLSKDIVVLKGTFIDISNLIVEAKKSRSEIETKLNESEVLLNSFSASMEELGSIDPGLFVEPITFNKIKAFENATSSGTLVSNALVIVIVLTAILLAAIITISERSENAQLRLDLSQTPKVTRIFGKLFAYIIVGFAEATLIVFVAGLKITLPWEIFGMTQLGYGVPMTIITLFNIYFAVGLIAATFAAIGVAVASFSKSQSTAILASLLLVVPMLFLSGIILPLEFMDPIMRTLSMLLPLTAANTLLTDVIARDMFMLGDIIPVTVLLTITIVSIVLVNFKKTIYK